MEAKQGGIVASTDELLEALDQRILDALRNKATGETVVALFEARAWLTNPAVAHGPRAHVIS
jgi:hypothetical protein